MFRSGESNEDKRTGVLDVFDRYNFTIKEDEPLDKEVAVDPEMLGKVFENMLEITERKSKGAFYTPREIVHYMCQESLIHYLDNALKGTVKKQDIETYIRKGHNALENDQRVAKKGETKTYQYILPESIRKNADAIDQKLIDIKICDPAIGSGAFPVGLLHELVNAQLVIKPHFTDKYLNTKLKKFGFTKKDKPSESRYIYRLKRHIIQESIYGVDIDASAIDIARLRLWLSLVVDEDDFDPIETLPNLDYKIICGNSLISRYPLDMPIDNVFKEFNKKVQSKDYNNQVIKNLVGTKEIDLAYYKKLTNDFLMESSHDKKVLFRELISEIKNAFTTTLGSKALIELSKARGAIENLQQSDIFGKQVGTKTQISKAKKHFAKLEKEKKDTEDGALFKNAIEWRFEFPNLLDKEGDFVGFDVVIGNPPYITYKGKQKVGVTISEIQFYLNKFHNSAEYKINSYALFCEQGINISKNKGSLSYIIPTTILQNKYLKNIRTFLLKDHQIQKVITFTNKVFQAVTDSLILNCVKNSANLETQFCNMNNLNFEDIEYKIFSQNIWLDNDENTINLKLTNSDSIIINKIKLDTQNLENHFKVYVGIVASGMKEFLSPEKLNNAYKPYLQGKDLIHYSYEQRELFINFLPDKLHSNTDTKVYEQKEKILLRKTGNILIASYDNKQFYTDQSIYNVYDNGKTNYISIKYTVSLLNSSILNWLYNKTLITNPDVYPYIKGIHLKKIPLKIVDKKVQEPFEIIVEYIITLKQQEEKEIQTQYFEYIIDTMVYELYFEQELKQANKEVLKHLTDLKPVTEEMNEEEKLAIIQAEFERLYHPEHPVRFSVETLDSIEEVRIIKEALR